MPAIPLSPLPPPLPVGRNDANISRTARIIRDPIIGSDASIGKDSVVAPVIRQKAKAMTPARAGTPTKACRFTGKRKVGNSSNNKSRDNKSGVQAFMVQRFVDKSNSQERNIEVNASRQMCYFPDTVPLEQS
jgi:hypothetical protein